MVSSVVALQLVIFCLMNTGMEVAKFLHSLMLCWFKSQPAVNVFLVKHFPGLHLHKLKIMHLTPLILLQACSYVVLHYYERVFGESPQPEFYYSLRFHMAVGVP
jgi:hypothetical protein